jgi:hypothetical protein
LCEKRFDDPTRNWRPAQEADGVPNRYDRVTSAAELDARRTVI